ncbi:transglycosylase SLT domain-containing protein [Halomonas shantousis]
MSRLCPPRRWLALLVAGTLSFTVMGNAFALDASDQAMKQALAAARHHQWERIEQVAVEDHILAGYVEYHRLLSRLSSAATAEVQSYLERYADSPLSDWMRGQAQLSFGRAGRYQDLLTISDGEPAGVIRQCYYYTALLDTEPARAAEGGRALWRVGRSQPDACDTLFDTLRARGEITDQDVWVRMMLAWEAGESGLMKYLGRQLGSQWQDGLDAVQRLSKDYAAITQVPVNVGPGGEGSGAMFAAAMYGFTRADTEAALEAWRKIGPHVPVSDTQRHAIEHDLAFYTMAREVENNQGWVDEVLPRLADGDLLELRVRRALAERQWQEVIDWVHAMPDDPRQDARWQYWLGRALEQLGDSRTAEKAYAAAASERSFFGFAAADRLGRPYDLNHTPATFTPLQRELVALSPAVQRTEALMRIGEHGLARSEWYAAVARASEDEAKALADYALERGWYAMTVHSTITAKLWDALEWRFPAAYRDSFMKWSSAANVDPYLLMGIARRESAFNPEAMSPVGARGLMQLMPGTAKLVSRTLGIPAPSAAGLLDPQTNIQLGSAYIKDMLDRYRGNRIAATAAYNAGPGRVDRWLRDAPQEFDLFVESIPFRETRDYVQAVLAYRVIFESLAKGGDTQEVAMLSPAETSGRYDASLLARN